MQKVYYDSARDFTIVDVSGVKPLEAIKAEFGDVNYQSLEIDEKTEYIKITAGNLEKGNIAEEVERVKLEQQQ